LTKSLVFIEFRANVAFSRVGIACSSTASASACPLLISTLSMSSYFFFFPASY